VAIRAQGLKRLTTGSANNSNIASRSDGCGARRAKRGVSKGATDVAETGVLNAMKECLLSNMTNW
jgi:hypothetical protein